MLALFGGVALFLLPARQQVRIAMIISMIVITYPVLRGADFFPVETMLGLAEKIQAERAESLEYRFTNEAVLLEHARKKPLFGWGPWGRNYVYDPETGNATTIADGFWVITIGTYGWVGYIAVFGLLVLPIYMLNRNWHRVKDRGGAYLAAGVAIMLTINLINLLPNAGLRTTTWLIAGALIGFVEQALRTRDSEPMAPPDAEMPRNAPEPTVVYSRRNHVPEFTRSRPG